MGSAMMKRLLHGKMALHGSGSTRCTAAAAHAHTHSVENVVGLSLWLVRQTDRFATKQGRGVIGAELPRTGWKRCAAVAYRAGMHIAGFCALLAEGRRTSAWVAWL
uniref:Uncharacterized protein n=1 Tax=Haptolina brevifila TaxID=156173 RepID=A0A7S2J563_9EUKA|mmetsp:Transcript_75973/g.150525  ORF Transcript_75973/g.150525 Transcript_75973/m.150525 type:complete len:106 (+) Transcript_75973:230-547(+)